MTRRRKTMKTLPIVLATLWLFGAAVAAEISEKKASAKPAAAPAAPKPAQEIDQFKYFVGTWHCEGMDFASPLGPEHRMVETVTAKMDLDDFWVMQRVTEKKTKENQNPLDGIYAWTYDPGQKKFVATWNDNTGGWAMQASKGWEGDKLVFLGEYASGGQKMAARDTYTKKSEQEHVHSFEIKAKDGWKKVDEETCKK
jgi:hypothetical protein